MAIVIAVAVLAGAAYLASPAIVVWMRHAGAGSGAASPSPSTPPPETPAPTPATTETPATTATPAPTPTTTATISPIATTTPSPSQAAPPLVHVVVRGETLNAIAARYGITLAALEKANGIKDPNLIYVGQRLVIPDR